MQLSEEEASSLLPLTSGAFEPPADLTELEGISTGSVLHTLRLRHKADKIYTSVGPVIIAVNPFKPTPESTIERIDSLIQHDPDTLPPHVFNVARSAYSVMISTGRAQSILISGESGAGKTGERRAEPRARSASRRLRAEATPFPEPPATGLTPLTAPLPTPRPHPCAPQRAPSCA